MSQPIYLTQDSRGRIMLPKELRLDLTVHPLWVGTVGENGELTLTPGTVTIPSPTVESPAQGTWGSDDGEPF